jgi:hypothetical protein
MVNNPGAAGGYFGTNSPQSNFSPRVARLGGESAPKALVLDGGDPLYHLNASTGDILNAPAGLTGLNPTHTIEAWVLNATLGPDNDAVAGFGTFTGDNQEATLLCSTSSQRGAVSHSAAGTDTPWNMPGGAPSGATWHHLVYTYDGFTTRVYADGALRNTKLAGTNVVNVLNTRPIVLGSANGANIIDTEGGATAIVRGNGATFNGTHLVLPGGTPATSPYVDLPNFILSTNGVSKGGTGQVSLEG